MEDGGNEGRLILVSGATGQQGGGVARSLLGRGFGVRALTRDPEKPEAKGLAALGAEVASGDLEDRSSIEGVLDGVHGVFSVQQSWETGVEGEVRQGVLLADAAKGAGVDHYVYSSVGSAHRERRASRTSRASGRLRSTCAVAAYLTRYCVRSSLYRTGGS
jgi:uncharacterized protein YbjT (DUF2867 family)